MTDTPCEAERPDSEWRVSDIETFPPAWRNWCKPCTEIAEELGVDDPGELTDVVLRRSGNGSNRGTGKILHLPESAVEEAMEA